MTMTTDQAFLLKMDAEVAEQAALRTYEANPTARTWMAHQRAVEDRDRAHAIYLDRLIAEQAALAALVGS